jgi:hypothetical protein
VSYNETQNQDSFFLDVTLLSVVVKGPTFWRNLLPSSAG